MSKPIKRVANSVDDVVSVLMWAKEMTIKAMNAVICASNGLNCISMEGDDSFKDIGHVGVSLIEVED